MTKLSRTSLVRVGITTLALTLTACGGGGGSDGTEAPGSATAALSRAENCEDLLGSIRADARAKIHVQADELRERGWAFNVGAEPTPYAPGGPGGIEPTPIPASGPPYDRTDTNTPLSGVDEPDSVATDGTRIYLLHDSELLVVPATPPESMTLGERIALEGHAHRMFVAEGRGLVVSSVSGVTGTLGGSSTCEVIGPPLPANDVRYCSDAFVKLTLLDLTAMPARVVREAYVEGHYVGARRHGMRARIIVQRSWGAPPGVGDPWTSLTAPALARDESEFRARVDAWELAALDAIDASALDQWLPRVRERVAGALVDRPLDCADVHVPPPGRSRHGALMLMGIDLAGDDGPLHDTTWLGLAAELYADADTLVLAQPDWQAQAFGEASTRTALHVFRLSSRSFDVGYGGSGLIPGTLLPERALDVRDDVVRVATQYNRAVDGRLVTRLHTARLNRGGLEILGATPDMAPGEVLEGVWFFGDRAYLATFFGIDPLVVDLRLPAHPTVLGKVEIPAFSDYLHLLDDRHLLTIGEDDQGNTALKILDVSEPLAPRLIHDYGQLRGFSSGRWKYVALTFDHRLGLLAIPLEGREGFAPVATLDLVAIDPTTGITPRGVVRHDAAKFAPCPPPFEWEGCFYQERMQRGLFIGDVVYSISDKEVRAQRLGDVGHTLARVALP